MQWWPEQKHRVLVQIKRLPCHCTAACHFHQLATIGQERSTTSVTRTTKEFSVHFQHASACPANFQRQSRDGETAAKALRYLTNNDPSTGKATVSSKQDMETKYKSRPHLHVRNSTALPNKQAEWHIQSSSKHCQ